MSSIELDYNKLNKFIQEIVRICPMHVNIYNITYLLSKPWTFTGYDERYKSLTYKTYNYHGNEVILHFKYDENLLQKLNRFIIKEFLTEFKLKDKRCLAIYPLPKKNIENLNSKTKTSDVLQHLKAVLDLKHKFVLVDSSTDLSVFASLFGLQFYVTISSGRIKIPLLPRRGIFSTSS